MVEIVTRGHPDPHGGTPADSTPSPAGSRPARDSARGPEPLWREIVGEQIREIRTHGAERITDVAERAGVSPQYLSEIERGVKDPSSEMLAAVAGALGTSVEGLAKRAFRLAPVVPLRSATPQAAPRATAHRVPGVSSSGPVLLAA